MSCASCSIPADLEGIEDIMTTRWACNLMTVRRRAISYHSLEHLHLGANSVTGSMFYLYLLICQRPIRLIEPIPRTMVFWFSYWFGSDSILVTIPIDDGEMISREINTSQVVISHMGKVLCKQKSGHENECQLAEWFFKLLLYCLQALFCKICIPRRIFSLKVFRHKSASCSHEIFRERKG